MLATPTREPGRLPVGAGWRYEVKWDGMRLLARTGAAGLRLTSRTERDVTTTFPDLAPLGDLPDLLLDGEVLALDAAGLPSFAALQDRIQVSGRAQAARAARAVPVALVLFDVLRHGGDDVTGLPLAERRQLLDALDLPAPGQLSPLYDDGSDLLAATAEQGLEGVVAKRMSSPYQAGRRSPDWVKAAHRTTRTVVVGGWRPQTGTSRTVGALLVGARDDDGALRYLGRVGAGIGPAAAAVLARALGSDVASVPFADEVPAVDARGAHWVGPDVVVEVAHLGFSGGGRLRQPAYRGVRTDTRSDPWPR